MLRKRLAAGTFVVLVVIAITAVASVTATAKPSQSQGKVKLGFITKFPVDFYFTLVGGAKTWQKAHKSVSVTYAQGKSATDDAGEIAAILEVDRYPALCLEGDEGRRKGCAHGQ